MANKICSPVVVENPIFPAIASHPVLYNCQGQTPANALDSGCCSIEKSASSCRVSTNQCKPSISSSLNDYKRPTPPKSYHSFNGKELELQFGKLQVTLEDDNDGKKTIPKKASKHSSALTLRAVKHLPLKRASPSKRRRKKPGATKLPTTASKFVLKPSKLSRCVKAAFNRSYTDFYRNRPLPDRQRLHSSEKELSVYHDFSTACCKELESIELDSTSSSDNSLRPRSSSLPAAGSPSISPEPSSPSTSTTNNENALDSAQKFSARRSRRKHLSKVDQKALKGDGNRADARPGETRGNRANKRRKSPLGSLATSSVQQSMQGLGNQTDNAQDNLDASIDRLADYLEDSILLPKKMSFMAEMMYT